ACRRSAFGAAVRNRGGKGRRRGNRGRRRRGGRGSRRLYRARSRRRLCHHLRFCPPLFRQLQAVDRLRRLRRLRRDAVQRHHAAQPEVPDRRCARRGRLRRPLQDPRRAGGGRHFHLDRRGLVPALGRAAGGRDHRRRAHAHFRECPEPAGVLFRQDQARRNPVALFDRSHGLRKLGEDLCRQRGAAVPGTDRRHSADAVPQLASCGGRAPGVPDHPDRSAHPHAEGRAGQLRAEAERVGAAGRGAGECRRAGGGKGLQPAAPRLR
ncbi:hypothetical protein KXV85_001002, partial [Aspergillus fumigatus]